ncbi:MAG: PAS domain S-box protein [Verrucomicrobiota bacterium]|nr:PAS domain S-box protein [Verrucomicrobiota bacterium]
MPRDCLPPSASSRAVSATIPAAPLLAAIVESSADAILTKDLGNVITSWNPGAEKLYGYRAAEAIGRPISLIIPREHLDEARRIWKRVNRGQIVRNWDTLRRRKDGTCVDVSVTVSPLRDSRRRIVGASIIAHDITARKGLERELRRASERLELAHEIACTGTFEWNVRTGEADRSRSLDEIYGLLDGGTIRRHHDWVRVLHPEDRKRVLAEVRRVLKRGDRLDLEFRILHPDGQVCWIHSRCRLFRDARRRPLRLIGVETDITRQKQAAEELRRSEQRFRLIVEHAPLAVIMLNERQRIVLANPPAQKLLGYRRGELLGRGLSLLIPPRLRSVHARHEARYRADPRSRRMGVGRELCALRKDGSEVPVEIGLTPIQTTEGRFVMATLLDVRQRKLVQDILRRTNEVLEHRVLKRTAELRRVNAALRREARDRRRLQHELLEISEREQRRIGRDIHDGLGQQLTGVAMLADLLQEELKQKSLPEAAAARRLEELVREAQVYSHKLVCGLYPVTADPHGLMNSLQQLAETVTSLHRVDCRFNCSPAVRLHDNVKATHLFRIAQEAVNNAIRHGRCRQINLLLSVQNGFLRLEIRNDGRRWFAQPQRRTDGMGLQTMKFRSEAMGGTLDIRPVNPHGTSIACLVPVGEK